MGANVKHARYRAHYAVFGALVYATACGASDALPHVTPATGEGGTTSTEPCVPYQDACPTGAYCQLDQGTTRCVPEGSVARDESCDGQRCQRGSICVYASDLLGDVCQQPCDLDVGACDITRHTCFVAVDQDGTEQSFGVCRY